MIFSIKKSQKYLFDSILWRKSCQSRLINIRFKCFAMSSEKSLCFPREETVKYYAKRSCSIKSNNDWTWTKVKTIGDGIKKRWNIWLLRWSCSAPQLLFIHWKKNLFSESFFRQIFAGIAVERFVRMPLRNSRLPKMILRTKTRTYLNKFRLCCCLQPPKTTRPIDETSAGTNYNFSIVDFMQFRKKLCLAFSCVEVFYILTYCQYFWSVWVSDASF